MANTAETTARNAEADLFNDVGMCLQQCRVWAGIPALHPDAATAWEHTMDRHPGDVDPPRGAMAYWTGGSEGHGHIACSLGGGRIRTTDGDGPGRVATRPLAWVHEAWGLPYAGWAWDINGHTIRHEEENDAMTPEDWEKLRSIVAEEVAANNPDLVDRVWDERQTVTLPTGGTDTRSLRQLVRETWQRVSG